MDYWKVTQIIRTYRTYYINNLENIVLKITKGPSTNKYVQNSNL